MADAENTNFEFGIENFKSYADLQSIELGKITLIYGSNSSGKSSLIQSLLCAAQSSESSTCSLSLNGDFVECGTYDSVLNRKNGNKKKDIVVKLSESSKPSESSFSISTSQSNREVHINFSPNFQVERRAFFSKGSTPGILEINRIELSLPKVNNCEDCDLAIKGAWLQANIPLPHTNALLHCLEDIEGRWMRICTKMIRLMAEDFKQCLQKISIMHGDPKQAIKGRSRYTISGRLKDLNLLYCTSLSIGAWIMVLSSDVAENTFTAFVFPPSMPFLEGEYFVAHNLGSKIRSLHDNLRKYYSRIEKRLCECSKIQYALGDESKASWGAIPISDKSARELFTIVVNDSDCISIKKEILTLANEIKEQIDNTTRLGSTLILEVGVLSERLITICTQLDRSTEALRQIYAETLINSSKDIESSDSKYQASISQALTSIFQHSGESIQCLADSVSLLTSAQTEIGLDIKGMDDGVSYSELNASIDVCRQSYNNLKEIFGSFEDIVHFVDLTVRLSDQIRASQRMIASMANNIHYIAFSGNKDRSAIEDVMTLMNEIQKDLKREEAVRFSAFSHELDSSAKSFKFIPAIKEIIILPSNILRDRILHLGPDRPTPKRSYGIEEINSDPQLKHLSEWESEKEDLFPGSYQNKYDKQLACLGILGDDIVRVNTSDPMLDKCSIGILRGKVITNICDLGFGISQVMPLVIASEIPDKDFIVVQQPETHLHPRMQADLGDLFIDSADTKKWVIETHSEVLMLRILRRVRIGRFSASDLKIYFVVQRDGASRIIEMKFSDSGDLITRWPKDFFAQESLEIF